MLLVVMGSFTQTLAQFTPDFSADITSGCSPLLVNFTDLTVGNVTTRNWYFGNGNSALGGGASVSAIYTAPGTYPVKLVVSDGVSSDSITKVAYITVVANPAVSFSAAPTSGCPPLPVAFTNTTGTGGAPITSWSWDYGDGSTFGSTSNTNHIYTQPGTFTVALTVTDANGCTGTANQTGLITVNPIPFPFFTAIPTASCQPPLTVNFINQTTGAPGSSINYYWDFGDGTNSTAQSPTHTFTTANTFTITLVATDPLGCSDTLVFNNFISTNGVNADFSTSADTICPGGTVSFANLSSGANQYTWDFGDGSPTGSGSNPSHSYANPGTYTVQLNANGGTNCSDSTSHKVVVQAIQANFTSGPNYHCEAPLVTQFTDLSVPTPASWQWFFGSGGGSTLQNPIQTIIDEGIYDDTLIVTSAFGCVDTFIIPQNTELFELDAFFLLDPQRGCAPLTVNFLDNSNPFDSIANWQWVFGDSLGLSNLQNPSFTFVDTGIHVVTLTITTPSGCSYEYSENVYVGSKQNAFFPWTPIDTCASDSITFIDHSTDSNIIDAYVWGFGDTTAASGKIVKHAFRDTGWMSVQLVVSHLGCRDTHTVDSAVYVLGPYVNFGANVDCGVPKTMFFNSEIQGATRWYWDFGDTTIIDSVNTEPVHTYANAGNYLVKLEAFNDSTGCSFYHEEYVNVYDLEPDLVLNDTNACAPFLLSVDGGNSVDAVNWEFSFGSGLPTTQYQSDTGYQYSYPGVYQLKMVVYDVNGCADSIEQEIGVFQPFADFTSNDTLGCVPLSVNFADLSQSDTTLVSWVWDFGNGDTSFASNPTEIYDALGTGKYDVTLTITDTFGCSSTVNKPDYITVIQPASFFQVNQQLCIGDSVYFNFAPQAPGYTYSWNFDDNTGNTSTALRPRYAWSSGGVFSPSLTVTDSNGCDSTYVAPAVIVQGINSLGLWATPRDSSCYPMPVVFTDTSGASIASWQWDFGEGDPPITVLGPVATNTYNTPGVYDVQLVITTTFGCVDTILLEDYINVGGPYAEFSVLDDTLCIGENAEFLIDSTLNVLRYNWDFGDGKDSTTSGSIDSLIHFYGQTGMIIPRMIYVDSSGLCPKFHEDTLFMHEVSTWFTLDDDEGCAPHPVQFTDSTVGANLWAWSMGNGSNSSNPNPSTTYDLAGNYPVTLIAINDSTGCKDTTIRNITVFPPPDPQITGPDHICLGEWVDLTGSGGITYSWTPAGLFSNPNDPNTSLWLTSSDTIGLVVSDANGCIDTAKKSIFVQFPPSFTIAKDTTIFRGMSVDLWINSLATGNLVAQWSPSTGLSCDDCLYPVASPNLTTNYAIHLSDSYGCFSLDTNLLINVIAEQELHIPNAFTPNGDSKNDVLYVVPYGMERLNYFRVFDRWGELLFESTDFNHGWDGTHKGKGSPIGVYPYTVMAEGYDGVKKYRHGFAVLLR